MSQKTKVVLGIGVAVGVGYLIYRLMDRQKCKDFVLSHNLGEDYAKEFCKNKDWKKEGIASH